MRTRSIIGKRIVAIQQSWQSLGGGMKAVTLEYLELEDGTRLIPFVHEGDPEHGVDLIVNKQHCHHAPHGRKAARRNDR